MRIGHNSHMGYGRRVTIDFDLSPHACHGGYWLTEEFSAKTNNPFGRILMTAQIVIINLDGCEKVAWTYGKNVLKYIVIRGNVRKTLRDTCFGIFVTLTAVMPWHD